MKTRYIFNTSGDYVAFISGTNLFTPNCKWMGFLKNGNEVYNSNDGKYMGFLTNDDRVVIDKTQLPKLPVLRPLPPLTPLMPLKPLKRLQMPTLPYPYVDVFENRVSAFFNSNNMDLSYLIGADIFASDNTYLGKVSNDRFDQNSLLNRFGNYGNQFNQFSLFNKFGPYGNKFSQLSPYNEFTQTPPRFVKGNEICGFLSKNRHIKNRIDPDIFFNWLNTL